MVQIHLIEYIVMAERDYNELGQELERAKRSVLPGRYRHYATGEVYELDGFTVDKETEKILVNYHNECVLGVTWSTSLEEWSGKIETDSGEMISRFTWVSEELGAAAINGAVGSIYRS